MMHPPSPNPFMNGTNGSSTPHRLTPLPAAPGLSPKRQPADATPVEVLAIALRRDILGLQRTIERNGNRAQFSYTMRRLEGAMVDIAKKPAEEQLPYLVATLAEKAAEAAGQSGIDPATVVGPLLAGAVPPSSEAPRSRGSVTKHRASVGSIAAVAAAALSASSRPGTTEDRSQATPGFNNDCDLSGVDPAEGDVRAASISAELNALLGPGTPMVALTEESLQTLADLGVAVPSRDDPGAAEPVDINGVVRTVAAAMAACSESQIISDVKARQAADVAVSRAQVMSAELGASRARLTEAEAELQALKHDLNASRFAYNAPRALTTVHDAPMSFEVERQYQREMHRAQSRVKELERMYAELEEAGRGDRERVQRQEREKEDLRRQLQAIADAKEAERLAKEEQEQLFKGVSRARGEEARISSVAVRQLEVRVGDLSDKLEAEREENETLRHNLSSLLALWIETDAALRAANADNTREERLRLAHASVYNQEMAERLERAQTGWLDAGVKNDEQSAATALQKQQLDDANALRQLSQSENTQWLDKLKASSEWKVLQVKVPDEAKQLGVRLLMLSSEKEKKEAALAASHAERMASFTARAEKEREDRLEKRRATIVPISAAEVKQQHDDLEAQINALLDPPVPNFAAQTEKYLAMARKRQVGFDKFFEEAEELPEQVTLMAPPPLSMSQDAA